MALAIALIVAGTLILVAVLYVILARCRDRPTPRATIQIVDRCHVCGQQVWRPADQSATCACGALSEPAPDKQSPAGPA